MRLYILLLLFIFGTAVGSFLNVLIDRLPVGKSPWKGRSKCDFCKKTLSPIDLVPMFSFIILNGKCRYCHKKLSIQYPLIEFITGLMFILIFNFQFFHLFSGQVIYNQFLMIQLLKTLCLIFVFSSFLAIFVADLKTQIIPDELIISSLIGITVLLFFQFFFSHLSIYENFLSALGAGGFFLLIYLITRGKGMGFGDVKLAPVLGLLLGYPKIIVGLYLAFLTGAVISIILVLLRKKKFKSKIAFGPFLIFGSTISFFYGGNIWLWFTGLLK